MGKKLPSLNFNLLSYEFITDTDTSKNTDIYWNYIGKVSLNTDIYFLTNADRGSLIDIDTDTFSYPLPIPIFSKF